MEWLAQNWLWAIFGILFVGMHMFGHGGHGADEHSGHDASDKSGASDASLDKKSLKNRSGHQH
tara:strand:- start:794 stop:982 length:189 start_codon:yes stop_codon:yes gene_type:complete